MVKILKNTHKQPNIELLRVRDYYFEKAKKIDKNMLTVSFIPMIITCIFVVLRIDNNYVDIFLGALSMLMWVAGTIVDNIIDDLVDKSNRFRELYDVKVYDELSVNQFEESISEIEKEEMHVIARKQRYADKYEKWYEEIFSVPKDAENAEVSEIANTICCQADNLIYGAHVYAETAAYHRNFIIGFSIIVFIISFLIIKIFGDVSMMILVLLSVYESLSIVYEKYRASKRAGKNNRELIDRIKSKVVVDRVMNGDATVLRELQDKVTESRKIAIFVPPFIRLKYLGENDNPFYIELDDIKNLYYEKSVILDAVKPSSAEEIETFDENGNESGTLKDLQSCLYGMLKDIVDVWEKEGIHYVLDGGTLIGAIREKGRFIFWDDDVDIAVPYEEVERAKTLIRTKLSGKYDIQDYSETFYSPRLSNFRVRDKHSFITEKDSYISDRYEKQGIFLDIYAYSPILYSIKVDSLYRRFRIHSLHKALAEVEYKMYREGYDTENGKKMEAKYFHFKYKYMKRVDWYLRNANNRNYWCYTPNYLNFTGSYSSERMNNLSEKIHKEQRGEKVENSVGNSKKKDKNKAPKLIRAVQKDLNEKWRGFVDSHWVLKKPQPYIPADSLWGINFDKERKTLFGTEYDDSGRKYSIPSDPENVLCHCYGDYRKSPYVPISKLPRQKSMKVTSYGEKIRGNDNDICFSASNAVTALKHIKTVRYYK